MPLPTRPVSMASVASVWGQQIHDYTFAPAGFLCSGGVFTALGGDVWFTLPIDTSVDDPGGYVDTANNRAKIPTDGSGLYLVTIRVSSDDGAATDRTQIRLRVNGTEIGRYTETQEGGDQIHLSMTMGVDVTVGDQLAVQARQVGSGARADMTLTKFEMIRIGFERGAPS